MSFKIVDNFYGAKGGPREFFGIGEEERDERRFSSEAEAREAIDTDRVYSEIAPDSPASRKERLNEDRGIVSKPREDQWGRRFMNLEVVPSDFMWCFGHADDRWLWQQPLEFEFSGPTSSDILAYTVTLDTQSLGRVETDSSEGRRWRAEAQDFAKGEFVSAYQAACALLRHRNDPRE